MHHRGLTLTELLIVLLSIAILAAIVLPLYNHSSLRSVKVTLQNNLRMMQQGIDLYRNTHDGTPPETIAPTWFAGNQIPSHPQKRWKHLPDLDVESSSRDDPEGIVLKPPDKGAYWYNNQVGIVRARVTKLPGHWQNTIDFYNEVNHSDATSPGPLGRGSAGTPNLGGGN